MENINEIHDLKYKKSKSKNNVDFGLLNALEFGQINNYSNNNNVFNNEITKKQKYKKSKNKKQKDKKHKNKDVETINNITNLNIMELKTTNNNQDFDNNSQSMDTDYLEKKFLKNNMLINKKNEIFAINLKDNNVNVDNINLTNNSGNILNKQIKKTKQKKKIKAIKSSNPIIQNEVIWYSDELDSNELELKYKNKYNKKNIDIEVIKENKQDKNNFNKNYFHEKIIFDEQIILDEERIFDEQIILDEERIFDEQIILDEERIFDEQIILDEKIIFDEQIILDEERIFDEQIILDEERIFDEQIFNENEINKNNETKNIIDNNENDKNNNKLSIILDTSKVEKYITENPTITIVKSVHRKILDCKKCILECKKINSNIFEWNIGCDPNCSTYKIFNNSIACSHIYNIIFMTDGKIYNPELVEIYINGEFIKKLYSDVINNLQNKNIDKTDVYYNITNSTYPLTSDIVITLKIKDTKQIEKVFFDVLLEKLIEHKNYLNNDYQIYFFCTTHELLYVGIETNITIGLEYGYYQDIYIVCDDIENNINSLSLTNSDVILLQDIPIQLLVHTPNLLCYSFKFSDAITMSGIKIDSDFDLKIVLNKSNPNSKVKIYGNKLFIMKKGLPFNDNDWN
jgi:hypothetical protein